MWLLSASQGTDISQVGPNLQVHLQHPARSPTMSNRRHNWHDLGSKLVPHAGGGDLETGGDLEDFGSAQRTEDALPIPGAAALLAVAFLWGTYGVTLRVLYEMPSPPHPAALTAVRGVIQVDT